MLNEDTLTLLDHLCHPDPGEAPETPQVPEVEMQQQGPEERCPAPAERTPPPHAPIAQDSHQQQPMAATIPPTLPF
eukprot:9249245-Prorocentrum_lima.AAC.1